VNNVDVIIPVHGTPIYLLETIQSIVNQQFINRIILVLDRVDQEYFSNLGINQNNLIIVKSNTPGIVSALNIGLQISEAEFVARIDSDDIMEPARIQKQLDFLASNPYCVCVGSNIEIFGGNFGYKIKKYPTSHKKIIKQLLYQNAMAHPSVMFRRKAVLDAGSYRPFFEGSEDYDLWFRLSKIGQLNNIDNSLTRYRTSPGQYSSKFSEYRVELDSLVRLLNSDTSKEFSSLNYNETISGSKIKECYQDSLKIVKESNHGLYRYIKNAEKFSNLLNYKNIKNKNILEYVIMILLTFRLILISPIFASKILTGRIIR
jgi:glycosyltransferase involved in cell wall biosynthesis